MAILIEELTDEQANKLLHIGEGQFSDLKAKEIAPKSLSKDISAFANSDGGELYIGIFEKLPEKSRSWLGFKDEEAANGHLQCFETLFPLGTDYQYEFLKCDSRTGLVLRVQINKTQGISRASNGLPYIRRGAQSLPVDKPEVLKRLEYAKGISSFETETVNASKLTISESAVILEFIRDVVPTAAPEPWLRKQVLLRDERPVVAGVLLFSDEPQAILPKHCGIKVYRYKTKDLEGSRETLAGDPLTIEGCINKQIRAAVSKTIEIIESIPRLGEEHLETITYPPETLHEIITNAVIHRDYSIADDVHIRIFDNRVEVQSPGRLPAHITIENILEERYARNGAIVRILNKFPDPPNKDIGEGLNTAFAAMHQLGLKEPAIYEKENAVVVIVRHEPLASPEEIIMDYLTDHPIITNSEARKVTHVKLDYQMKKIFGRMVARGMIEQIPGTKTRATAYRKPKKDSENKT